MFPRAISVNPQGKYKIWLKYADETQGTLDLQHLSKQGIFCLWESEFFFNSVHLDTQTNSIVWNEDIDLCPNSLYLRLKNMNFEDWKNQQDNATN